MEQSSTSSIIPACVCMYIHRSLWTWNYTWRASWHLANGPAACPHLPNCWQEHQWVCVISADKWFGPWAWTELFSSSSWIGCRKWGRSNNPAEGLCCLVRNSLRASHFHSKFTTSLWGKAKVILEPENRAAGWGRSGNWYFSYMAIGVMSRTADSTEHGQTYSGERICGFKLMQLWSIFYFFGSLLCCFAMSGIVFLGFCFPCIFVLPLSPINSVHFNELYHLIPSHSLWLAPAWWNSSYSSQM